MCRNIKRLRHPDHPPTDAELHDAALQCVRKISGFHAPSQANGPVNNAALDGRLSQAAAQYRSYAPVPRIAFYDIAFPKDCGELAATDQQAVLVVTAVVQDSTELPPASIYLRSGSTDTKLPQ